MVEMEEPVTNAEVMVEGAAGVRPIANNCDMVDNLEAKDGVVKEGTGNSGPVEASTRTETQGTAMTGAREATSEAKAMGMVAGTAETMGAGAVAMWDVDEDVAADVGDEKRVVEPSMVKMRVGNTDEIPKGFWLVGGSSMGRHTLGEWAGWALVAR
jgi:hypothetical protein